MRVLAERDTRSVRGPVRGRNADSAFVSTDTVQSSHMQSVIRSSLVQSVTETRSYFVTIECTCGMKLSPVRCAVNER